MHDIVGQLLKKLQIIIGEIGIVIQYDSDLISHILRDSGVYCVERKVQDPVLLVLNQQLNNRAAVSDINIYTGFKRLSVLYKLQNGFHFLTVVNSFLSINTGRPPVGNRHERLRIGFKTEHD